MADNKQYITQIQENGSVIISEDVICAIASHAINEVEGVNGLHTSNKKGWGKALKITLAEEDSLIIDCGIEIVYGQSVVGVSEAVQKAVSAAVSSMAGVDVKAVNVSVNAIVRK